MSLKAKIDAVIYASEEPVTLAQLAGLLGLEAQAELDRIAAKQANLHLAENEPEPEAEELAIEPDAAAEGEVAAAAAEPGETAADRKAAKERER